MRCLQFLVFSSILFGSTYATDPKEAFGQFLKSLVESVLNKKPVQSFFQNNFSYKSCELEIDTAIAIELLSKFPFSLVSFNLKSSKYLHPNVIEYQLSILSKKNNVDIILVFNDNNGTLQLVTGNTIDCGRNLLRSKAGDGSDAVVKELIGGMDSSSADFANFFTDDFLFLGCLGNYNKQQTLQLFAKMPKGFKTNIISSKFVGKDQIELQIGNGRLVANFKLLLVGNKWLVHSGSMEKC
uniref:NTF2-like domain-containing protein n=1 Tax=Caenorhabditis japonica TaxID=281687 RepID=A0A8R1E0F0_CAEJA